MCAVEVAKPIPPGYAVCPCCKGTKQMTLSPKERTYSWNAGKTTTECRNCGGQTMYGVAMGYTKIDPRTGRGCYHTYSSKNVGRCLTQYTCTKCKDTYTIDSGD